MLIENSGESEIFPPRSGGWRVSRRRGRVFSYLAAYGDSSVAGNQLRSSRMPEFLAVLVLHVPCTKIYYFSVLSGYFGAATPAGGKYPDILLQRPCNRAEQSMSAIEIAGIRITKFAADGREERDAFPT